MGSNLARVACEVFSQILGKHWIYSAIDEFQINEINVDLCTSGFDNEVLSVDTCAVWRQRVSLYCLPRIGVVTWHRKPRFQCGSARTGSIWKFVYTHVGVQDNIKSIHFIHVHIHCYIYLSLFEKCKPKHLLEVNICSWKIDVIKAGHWLNINTNYGEACYTYPLTVYLFEFV